jgi:hypothetical protein
MSVPLPDHGDYRVWGKRRRWINLEKLASHEKKKTRTNSNSCQNLLCHPLGELISLGNQLFFLRAFALLRNACLPRFVNFVSFVDEKPF